MASTENNIKIKDHPTEDEGYIIPSHYVEGRKFQLIDIIEDILTPEEFQGWCKGIILKYVARGDSSNRNRALLKAKYYLDELISYMSNNNKKDDSHLKPDYYKNNKIETIDIIDDELPEKELEGFYLGMVIRYISRSAYKGHPLDDYCKAKYYLDRLLKFLGEIK